MNRPDGKNWKPGPEILAAYADGELQGGCDCSQWRERVEAWLAANPDAREMLQSQKLVARMMSATTPAEPSDADWSRVWAEVERHPMQPSRSWRLAVRLAGGLAAGAIAASVLFLLGVFGPGQPPRLATTAVKPEPPVRDARPAPAPQDALAQVAPVEATPVDLNAVLPVAKSDEVEIVYVSGQTAGTVLVGRGPLIGPIILLAPHEVQMQTPASDPTGTSLRITPGSVPMMWTPIPGVLDKSGDQ